MQYKLIYTLLVERVITNEFLFTLHADFKDLWQFAQIHSSNGTKFLPIGELIPLYKMLEPAKAEKASNFLTALVKERNTELNYTTKLILKGVMVEAIRLALINPAMPLDSKIELSAALHRNIDLIENYGESFGVDFDDCCLSDNSSPMELFKKYFGHSEGHILFFLGLEKIGKTTFILQLLKSEVKLNKKILYLDWANGKDGFLYKVASIYMNLHAQAPEVATFKKTQEYKNFKSKLTYEQYLSRGQVERFLMSTKADYVIFDDIHKLAFEFSPNDVASKGILAMYQWLHNLLAKTKHKAIILTHPNTTTPDINNLMPTGGQSLRKDAAGFIYFERIEKTEQAESADRFGYRRLSFAYIRDRYPDCPKHLLFKMSPYKHEIVKSTNTLASKDTSGKVTLQITNKNNNPY